MKDPMAMSDDEVRLYSITAFAREHPRKAADRIVALEAALREISTEVKDAHDGAHIFRVREICAGALAR